MPPLRESAQHVPSLCHHISTDLTSGWKWCELGNERQQLQSKHLILGFLSFRWAALRDRSPSHEGSVCETSISWQGPRAQREECLRPPSQGSTSPRCEQTGAVRELFRHKCGLHRHSQQPGVLVLGTLFCLLEDGRATSYHLNPRARPVGIDLFDMTQSNDFRQRTWSSWRRKQISVAYQECLQINWYYLMQ